MLLSTEIITRIIANSKQKGSDSDFQRAGAKSFRNNVDVKGLTYERCGENDVGPIRVRNGTRTVKSNYIL